MKVNYIKWKPIFFLTVFMLTIFLGAYGCSSSSDDNTPSTSNSSPSETNNEPVATDSAITVNEDSTTSNTMTASDADGDAITFSIVTEPSLGTVAITDDSTGAFTYTPDSDETGSDSFTFKVSDGQADSNTATVAITISDLNDAPSASVLNDFSVEEFSTVILTGSGTDVEDGQALTYSWTQTAGSVSVTLTNADSATAQFEAPAVETVAGVALSFKLTVTDNGGLTAEDTVDVTISSAGHIIGSVSSPAYHTDLTEEGTLDWASWGILTDTSFQTKAAGTDEITNYTEIGDVTPNRSEGNPVSFSWTDGHETAPTHNPISETFTRVYFSDADVGEGIRLSVPAGVEDKILKVYLGAYSHKGKVTARLASDPGVTLYTVSLDSPDLLQEAWVVTLLFGAENDGDTLIVDFEVEEDTGVAGGHINIAAATLMSGQATTPVFSPLPGTYTDPLSVTISSAPSAASIRYTTDGTQPSESSSLYSGAVSISESKTINAKAYCSGLDSSSVASASYSLNTSAAGTLAANVAPAPYHTDLTEEGTRDWASWGIVTATSFQTKNTGTNELSDYDMIGTVTPNRSEGNPVSFTWTDGHVATAPHSPAYQTRTRVYFSDTDENEGIRLTIPANDIEKTLRVYLGAYSMNGTVSVEMQDGSVPTYTTTLSSPDEDQEAWVVTVDFAAPQGTASNLIFEYVQGQDPGVAGGHINIAAASLSD